MSDDFIALRADEGDRQRAVLTEGVDDVRLGATCVRRIVEGIGDKGTDCESVGSGFGT